MRKKILAAILVLIVLIALKFYKDKPKNTAVLIENTALIEKQIKQVGKLVVTEGHFSEVFTYKNSKAILGDIIEAEKKALVVVNAEVTIAYDLSQLEYHIDAENKILTIINIPDPELKVHPELEYYDIQEDYLNPFEANDYNTIAKTVKQSIGQKVEKSGLKANAKQRLLSELSKLLILTNAMNWTLQYNENPIAHTTALEALLQ